MTFHNHNLCLLDTAVSFPVATSARPQRRSRSEGTVPSADIFRGHRRRGSDYLSVNGHEELTTPDIDSGSFTLEFLILRVLPEQHRQIRDRADRLSRTAIAAARSRSDASEQQQVRALMAAFASIVNAHLADEDMIFPSLLTLELAYLGEFLEGGCSIDIRDQLQAISHRNSQHRQDVGEIRRRAGMLIANANPADRTIYSRAALLARTISRHLEIEDTLVLRRADRMQAELFGQAPRTAASTACG